MDIQFGDIQETALITLAIRASETSRPNPRIRDPKAKEIIDALGVDVSKFDPFLSHEGVVARTIMFRDELKRLLKQYPDAICINLGCGFDDKFSQVDNGTLTWFDVDLPDQIAVRRKVFEDRERCTMMDGDALDGAWTKNIPKADMYLIVMEGVLEYFSKEQVKTCLNMLCDSFPHGYLLAEQHSPFLEKHGSHHDAVKHTNASFGWGTKSGREYLELEPGLKYISEKSYNEEMKKYTIRGKLFAVIGKTSITGWLYSAGDMYSPEVEKKMKTSVQYKLLYGLFKTIGVNKMLDKKGADFDKLLESCRKKQKKPLKVPYKKMQGFDILTKSIDGTTCYVVRVRDSLPQKAVLYLFGGGYILPPDPGDIVLCGQIAENCDAEVWFPLYPMAPEHTLAETLQSTLQVYRQMLENYDAADIRFFGTSSGGGQAMSLCVYIRHENIDVPLPGRLVLQSPGLQVPPSESQKAEMERRKKADVMIPPGFFDAIAPVLATGDEAYLLSPLLYDLTGFPETDVFYGTREIMIAYLKDFQNACKKYGVKLHTHIGKGMMHCWGAMEFVPEAKTVRQEYFLALM